VDALLRAIGVTRVARVTGLDRCGVEVACAIRPLGHVLQVSNGKGETWKEARATALSEAAELWAAERVRPGDLVHGAARELDHAWEPRDLVAARLWSEDARIAWLRARELFTGAEVLVPAQVVHCLPRGSPPLGPLCMRWTSNGMGAHPLRGRALRHALLEVMERDQLARALSRGWTPRAIAGRKLDASSLPLWKQLRDNGFEAHVFDLSGALAVAGAILVDLEEGPVPVTAGYACGLSPEEAVRGALLEAAQSRLTDVHGAREDVTPADRASMRALRDACERSRPRRKLGQMPRLQDLRAALRGQRIAVVELAREPLHVVKVVAPELRLSELL
jgi:ribosomal protein S12 methylthiotransferase accessory factor